MQIQSARRQYRLPYISAMPTNPSGPNDNSHSLKSHVMPALSRRFHEAKLSRAEVVVSWGTDTPQDFVLVDDMAATHLFLLENPDNREVINPGSGVEDTIAQISLMVDDSIGYTGRIEWDASKPDGMPHKPLDVGRLKSAGSNPRIPQTHRLATTYKWFLDPQVSGRQ